MPINRDPKLEDCLVSKKDWPTLARALLRKNPRTTWSAGTPLTNWSPWSDLDVPAEQKILVLQDPLDNECYWGRPTDEAQKLKEDPLRVRSWIEAKKILSQWRPKIQEFEF